MTTPNPTIATTTSTTTTLIYAIQVPSGNIKIKEIPMTLVGFGHVTGTSPQHAMILLDISWRGDEMKSGRRLDLPIHDGDTMICITNTGFIN
jgi:hypothetical protein